MAALWRVEEAAEYLGIRPKTLYEWVRLGRVPYRKIGFNVRFDPDELEQWTRGQSRGGGELPAAAGGSMAPKDGVASARVSHTLVELANDAAVVLRKLERDVGTNLSFPARRKLLALAERLENAACTVTDG